VDDLAGALIKMADWQGNRYGVFNIGTGYQYNAREIVEVISGILKKDIEILQEHQRIRQVDKLFQKAWIEKISKTFGWSPTYSLEDGLRALLLHEGLIHQV
jgi:nucleoside-diphosphate-sugar epimerase